MRAVTKVKLALTVMGLIFFFAGVRLDDTRLRTIAIVLVAVAWAMRFIKPGPTATDDAPRG